MHRFQLIKPEGNILGVPSYRKIDFDNKEELEKFIRRLPTDDRKEFKIIIEV